MYVNVCMNRLVICPKSKFLQFLFSMRFYTSTMTSAAERLLLIPLCQFSVAAKHLVRGCGSGILVSGVYAPGTTKLAASGALTVNIMCCSNVPCPR